MHQTVCPKVPYRPQQRRTAAEIQHNAPARTQNHIAPHLARRPVKHKEKGGEAQKEAVDAVQRRGEPGEAQAKGAQEVIQYAGAEAQQDGLGEDRQLFGDLNFHRYPNSRLKRPPRPAPPSS